MCLGMCHGWRGVGLSRLLLLQTYHKGGIAWSVIESQQLKPFFSSLEAFNERVIIGFRVELLQSIHILLIIQFVIGQGGAGSWA